MPPTSLNPLPPRAIQVAGIRDQAEADLLIRAGVTFLGFPLRLTVHREDIAESAVTAIVVGLPPGVHGVLITYLDQAESIAALCRQLGVDWVQLHGEIAETEVAALRRQCGATLGIIKSLVVRHDNAAALAQAVATFAPHVDAFITDTFDPQTGACGATGKLHDWAVSRRLVELSPVPVILAGGLTPDNVAAGIRQVRPAGVDVHTGVENAAGAKDPARVRQFVAAARTAFASLSATPD